jgi:hypothetical protein
MARVRAEGGWAAKEAREGEVVVGEEAARWELNAWREGSEGRRGRGGEALSWAMSWRTMWNMSWRVGRALREALACFLCVCV